MPEARYEMAAVVLDNNIYVIGGRDRRDDPLRSVLRFDVDENRWYDDVAPLDEPRVETAAVVLDDKIYLIAGADEDGEAQNDVVVYDPVSNAWSDGDNLRNERQGHSAVVVDGRIHVVGGRDDDGRLVEEIEVYDPDEEEWIVSENWRLNHPRVSFALVVIDDTLYALGGFGGSGTAPVPLANAERGTPGGGISSFIPPGLFISRGRLAAVTLNESAYFMGGVSAANARVLDEVLHFTPSAERLPERWTRAPSMLTPRESFAAVNVGGDLYAIGGRSDNTTLSSMEALRTGTSIAEEPGADVLPFRLEQNHPNPFTNSTTIPFVVESDRPEPVTLEIYDLQGRLVASLVNGYFPSGRHEVVWSGNRSDGSRLSTGVYVYTLRQGERRQTRILTRIR